MQSEFALAWADLEEAREIAERGEMKLFLADYHLEACRLEIKEQKANSKKQARLESKEQKAKGKKQADERLESKEQKANGKRQAEEHLNIAAEMIEKMGYGRRKAEVEELRRELKAL